MNKSFLRKCEVIVYPIVTAEGTAAGDPIVLTDLRITFQTQAQQVATPNSAIIRVYNITRDLITQLVNNNNTSEYLSIVLNAGYVDGNYGAIFKGSIRQMRYGKETPTETFVEFLASDGDIAYQQLVSKRYPKGTPVASVIGALADAVSSSLPEKPYIDNHIFFSGPGQISLPRAQVLWGLSADMLNKYAASLNATWTVTNGKLEIITEKAYSTVVPIQVNVATGLIGYPIQTDQGIKIKTLLDPRMRGGSLVQINNSDIIALLQMRGYTTYNTFADLQYNAPLSPDGLYTAFAVEHEGDTRGNEWYTNIVGVALDPTSGNTPLDIVEPGSRYG